MKNVLFHIIKRQHKESCTAKGTRHPTYICVYIRMDQHLTISYLRSSEIAHCSIYLYTHSTDRMGEEEMIKKHEHIHTSRQEWSNEVALIQALRR